jgi:hypothetical protein
MSKNRFRSANTFNLKASLSIGGVIALLLIAGLSYVFLSNRAAQLAGDVEKQRRILRNYDNRNRQLYDDIARVTSQVELSKRVQGMNLVRIAELDVVRLDQGPVARLERNALATRGNTP